MLVNPVTVRTSGHHYDLMLSTAWKALGKLTIGSRAYEQLLSAIEAFERGNT